MFEFCYIQLLSGCTQVTHILELNISCTVNVAIPISLVGLSQVQYSSGLGHALDTVTSKIDSMFCTFSLFAN